MDATPTLSAKLLASIVVVSPGKMLKSTQIATLVSNII
jgi:hypothetical protein